MVVVIVLLVGVVGTGVHLIRTSFRRIRKDGSPEAGTDIPLAQTMVAGERRRQEPAFGESTISVSGSRIALGIFLLVGGSCGLAFTYAMRMASHAGP